MKRLIVQRIKSDASPLKRILASLIDLLLINFIIIRPFSSQLKKLIPATGDYDALYNFYLANPDIMNRIYGLIGSMCVLIFLYFTLLEWKTGQSIGKIIIRLTVISEEKELKLWQVLLRNIVFFPIFPLVLLWIIDPIYLFFSKKKRRLMDILSKTRVIEERVVMK